MDWDTHRAVQAESRDHLLDAAYKAACAIMLDNSTWGSSGVERQSKYRRACKQLTPRELGVLQLAIDSTTPADIKAAINDFRTDFIQVAGVDKSEFQKEWERLDAEDARQS